MINSQFVASGNALKGKVITRNLAGTNFGICFPKIQANNVKITLTSHNLHDAPGSSDASASYYTYNGSQRTQGSMGLPVNYGQAKGDTVINITDGRIMEGMWFSDGESSHVSYTTQYDKVVIEFIDVKNVK